MQSDRRIFPTHRNPRDNMAASEPENGLYIRRNALDDAIKHTKREAPNETIGFMLGKVRTIDSKNYTVIERVLTAKTVSTRATTKFKKKSLGKIASVIKDDEIIVGWYHSHPGYGCFMSETDIATQTKQFCYPHNVALVIDPIKEDFRFFSVDEEGNCRGISHTILESID